MGITRLLIHPEMLADFVPTCGATNILYRFPQTQLQVLQHLRLLLQSGQDVCPTRREGPPKLFLGAMGTTKGGEATANRDCDIQRTPQLVAGRRPYR